MHEFVVILRNGQRYTVRADRVVLADERFVALAADGPNGPDPLAHPVAIFARGEVAVVVARDHLLAEEKGDPISPQYVVGGDSDIPF